MSITDELNELIALHGNCRDALNVTLAKLRHAQDEIAILKEAAQPTLAPDGAKWCENCVLPPDDDGYCIRCGELTRPAGKANR